MSTAEQNKVLERLEEAVEAIVSHAKDKLAQLKYDDADHGDAYEYGYHQGRKDAARSLYFSLTPSERRAYNRRAYNRIWQDGRE